MSFHLVAFSEGIAAAGTIQPLAAIQDDQIFTDGDDVRIPERMNALLGAFGFGASMTRARVVAPSLRAFINHEVTAFHQTENPQGDDTDQLEGVLPTPLPLQVGEFINFESDGGAAGPEDVTGLVMLGEGPVQPVQGQIRTIKATAAIAGAQAAWTSGNLTFLEDLPAGRYQVVGGKAFPDANPGAFRLIFREGGPRPGTVMGSSAGSGNIPGSRYGRWGVWGEFDINQPPQLEVLALGGVQATQEVWLDLIRVGG